MTIKSVLRAARVPAVLAIAVLALGALSAQVLPTGGEKVTASGGS